MFPFTEIPDIQYGRAWIRIETPAVARWSSLFSHHRTVLIHRGQERVTVTSHWLWGVFRQERVIPLAEITGVETDYHAMKDEDGNDTYQTYTILLRLKTRYERFPIARFRGCGENVFPFGKGRHKEKFDECLERLLAFFDPGMADPFPI